MKHKKILFASMPLDGHFNPLTGLAMYLKEAGHDVRWYTGKIYGEKLSAMGIHHYPCKKALDVNQFNLEEMFPERTKMKNGVKKLKFDITNTFILRSTEFFADILELNREFNFDLMICDIAFTGLPFVKEKMNKRVISIGVFPITETSVDLAPNGLAMHPSTSYWGRKKQNILRFISDEVLFRSENQLIRRIFDQYGVQNIKGNLFDTLYRKSDLVLQIGSPGFEYQRSDLSKNIHFIGALLPYRKKQEMPFVPLNNLKDYNKVILVTQGTVEKDTRKLLQPTLNAFAGSNNLVIATTGGSCTAQLREQYKKFDNVIIEDFIPFREVMPMVDVFVTNGGYGGVMLGIEHKLPLVVSGIHEGKNEINARVGYFELGIDLKTETPSPEQIKQGVEEVLNNPKYRNNVNKLGLELSQYNSMLLCERFIAQLFNEDVDNSVAFMNNLHVA